MWNDWKVEKRRQAEFEQLKALDASRQVPANPSATDSMGTRDLFLDTLTKIGCQYTLGEGEDKQIYFAYQGEHFIASASNDSYYVHIWDLAWERVELYDIDEISRMRKAINESNFNVAATTVFTIDEEEKQMIVHCKNTIPFVYSMPNIETYLKVELNSFFRAHQLVATEMDKLRVKEESVKN